MSMTVVITRNVPPRFRGFLASVMLEIAPGVYTSPRMSAAVRERVWTVVGDWFTGLPTGPSEDPTSLVMTWRDTAAPGGQRVETLGVPAKTLVDTDGVWLMGRLNTAESTTDVP